MLATVAHEVRNPMTTIRAMTQMLARENPDYQHEYELMMEELDRAIQLLTGTLNMTREQSIKNDRLDIHELLGRCLDLLAEEFSCSEIELEADFDNQCPVYVYADENKLKQAFLNICYNALEAMPTGGRLQISTRVDADRIVLMFRDNGRGIPRELMEEIYAPFFTTKESGTGLGLSISSQIIRESRGQLDIESQLNQGTVVTITLPISYT
jgi:signal transduction histidine kinase